MAAADDDGSSKKSTFWWLEAVRYVVAGVVVVLIAAVVINAIKVIFRPDSLHMVVVGGSMPARNLSSSDDDTYKSVALDLNLRCQNPSGRARMYYTGITFYLLNSTTSPFSPTLDKDALLYSDMPDIAVAQQDTANSVSTTTVENVTSVYASQFNILYRGGSFSNMTMKLNGNLITEVTINGTRMTTYLCGPLLIGGGSDDGMYLQDVPCKEMQNGHFIQ